MRVLFTCAAVIVAATSLVADDARACSCDESTPEGEFAQADIVMRATVATASAIAATGCRDREPTADPIRRVLVLDVHEVFKGDAPEEFFVVDADGSCDSGLAVDDERVFFLRTPGDGLFDAHELGACSPKLAPEHFPQELATDAQAPNEGTNTPECFDSCALTSSPPLLATLLVLVVRPRRRRAHGTLT